jgi:hypothetical protein
MERSTTLLSLLEIVLDSTLPLNTTIALNGAARLDMFEFCGPITPGGLHCAIELKGALGPSNIAALDGLARLDILNGTIALDSATALSGTAKLSSASGLGSMTGGVAGIGAATSNNATLPNDTTTLNAAGLNALAGMTMLGGATAASQTAGFSSAPGLGSTVVPNSAMVPNGTMVPNSATVTACNVARLEVVNSMTMLDDTVGRLGSTCAAALDILHDAEVFGSATVHSSESAQRRIVMQQNGLHARQCMRVRPSKDMA